MTAERTIVTIEAEHIGKIELTPAQFAMFVMAASVGIDGFEGTPAEEAIADQVWAIINKLEQAA
jgi:hypothetical protein